MEGGDVGGLAKSGLVEVGYKMEGRDVGGKAEQSSARIWD